VPERREELTTEGGLDVVAGGEALRKMVGELTASGIHVSLFIDADPRQIEATKLSGAYALEFHTGRYCHSAEAEQQLELKRLVDGAYQAASLGLHVHAGHGLTYDNVGPVAAIEDVEELNIGHFMMGEALFEGLTGVVIKMRVAMDAGRAHAKRKPVA
jgi:pyridoxine 5-phosphate synthase